MYHTKKYVLYDTYYTISYVQMKHCLRGAAPIGLLCDKDWICTIKRYWKRSGECLDLLCLMNSYMTWICIIYEFVQNKQGTADDGHYSEDFMVAENNMILDTTQKPKINLFGLLTLVIKTWVDSKTHFHFSLQHHKNFTTV